MFWVGFALGLLIGGVIGVFTIAACQLADRADRNIATRIRPNHRARARCGD